LTQAALRMKAARDANDREGILSAVRINWRLWTVIQAELLDPQCSVPMDIRTNVLSLAQFVDKHSVEIIGKPAPGLLDILISINRELAGGLFTTPQSQSTEIREQDPPHKEGGRRSPVEQIAQTRSGLAEGPSDGSAVRIST
jgi:flagellar biosynthesis activator protein FlaF